MSNTKQLWLLRITTIMKLDTYIAASIAMHSSPGARVAQWVRSLDLTVHTSLSPIRRGFVLSFVNYKKEYTRLAAPRDKVYQLLAQGERFFPGTPASSTTKTEILLKMALNTKTNQIHNSPIFLFVFCS